VLVSPQRTKRPWQGAVEKKSKDKRPRYDPDCYLCPGNKRAGGNLNPDYKSTHVFTNDFPALLPKVPERYHDERRIFQAHSVKGTSRVICFSPRHDLTLPEMRVDDILEVVKLWIDQYKDLAGKYPWVQIFENKGEIMGASNPHPHGQIWACDQVPTIAEIEDVNQREYYIKNNSSLLVDYLRSEKSKEERVVIENEEWAVVVPYWAVWPFETLLLPKRNVPRMDKLFEKEKTALAAILKILLTKYDNIFKMSFPYSMGWHNAPSNLDLNSHWQLHAHFYPPLLRSATVKKFMVGYEMLSEAQRDISAEESAAKLKEQSVTHYKKG
jgi:UDPglucose--hexose-1-phosphate uridylyltransferase